MLFYLHLYGEPLNESTKLKAFDLDLIEYGSGRQTLIEMDIINIDGKYYEVRKYVYLESHGKGVYIISPYTMRYYNATRKTELDIKSK